MLVVYPLILIAVDSFSNFLNFIQNPFAIDQIILPDSGDISGCFRGASSWVSFYFILYSSLCNREQCLTFDSVIVVYICATINSSIHATHRNDISYSIYFHIIIVVPDAPVIVLRNFHKLWLRCFLGNRVYGIYL